MSGEGGSEGEGREEREGKEEMEGGEKEGPGRKEGRGRSRAGPRTVVGARSAQIAPRDPHRALTPPRKGLTVERALPFLSGPTQEFSPSRCVSEPSGDPQSAGWFRRSRKYDLGSLTFWRRFVAAPKRFAPKAMASLGPIAKGRPRRPSPRPLPATPRP